MNKRIVLKSIGEEGYTIILTQDISKKGKVIGIGSFQMRETPEMAQVRRRKKKEEKLIVLNEYFFRFRFTSFERNLWRLYPNDNASKCESRFKNRKKYEED